MIYFPKLGEYVSEKILRSAPVYILNGGGGGGETIFRKNIHPWCPCTLGVGDKCTAPGWISDAS